MSNWTPRELKQRLIVSAALPYDDQNEIDILLHDCSDYLGIAVLPVFVKGIRVQLPVSGDCRLVGLVSYPSGGTTCNTKVTEIRQMVYQGCDSFNVVANTALILSEDWDEVECDLISVVKSAHGKPVTKTIEAAYLNEGQIRRMVEICKECGVEAISTTTGWLPKLPDSKKISFIKSLTGDSILVEAAGILSFDQFKLAAEAGADRYFIRREHAAAILSQLE
jgi:deoxyribose-phosphate aldolase